MRARHATAPRGPHRGGSRSHAIYASRLGLPLLGGGRPQRDHARHGAGELSAAQRVRGSNSSGLVSAETPRGHRRRGLKLGSVAVQNTHAHREKKMRSCKMTEITRERLTRGSFGTGHRGKKPTPFGGLTAR